MIRKIDAGVEQAAEKRLPQPAPFSYLSHRERRLRKEASLYAGC
jgi:hypothetical protein